MKTAAAALILYLGLGCAAGLPVEKLMSRARRLSTDDDNDLAFSNQCSNEIQAFLDCPTAAGTTLGDDDYWAADDDDDFNPTSCADVQTQLTGLCGEGPARQNITRTWNARTNSLLRVSPALHAN